MKLATKVLSRCCKPAMERMLLTATVLSVPGVVTVVCVAARIALTMPVAIRRYQKSQKALGTLLPTRSTARNAGPGPVVWVSVAVTDSPLEIGCRGQGKCEASAIYGQLIARSEAIRRVTLS